MLLAFVVLRAAPQAPPDVVNFGPLPGERGVWELDYIENMADHVLGSALKSGPDRGSAAEPHIPFLPWSCCGLRLQRPNAGEVRSGIVLHSSRRPSPVYRALPDGDRSVPGQKRIFFFFEVSHVWYEVYLDGRAHPSTKDGTFLGHAVGRYEDGGKTLVIEVRNFNEMTWLDFAGHPHTSSLHVVEKLTRPTANQLHLEVTIDDPGAYSQAWTAAWNMKWWPNGKLDEYVCEENNKYIRTLKDDFGNPMVFGK
jgi:hypothetical protein